MGKRAPFIIAALGVILLIGGAIALYSYDSSRDDLIGKGVTIAGVDVSGMRQAEATRVLQQQLSGRLHRPIVVSADGRRFRLTARRAEVTTDVGGMVSEAVAASRQGNLVQRSWRNLTGGEVNRTVALRM